MRIRLIGGALLLSLLCVLTVLLASPSSPVIGPLRPIEQLWDLEDERLESEAPLVTRLERDGVPLGYDEAQNAFFCPLPLDTQEWPSLTLTAPGVPGLRLCFADDYLYDSPADAMAQGTHYRVFAYTESAFSYFDIVFTGMAQLCLYGDEDSFSDEDVPVQAAYTGAEASVLSSARVHYRGGVTRGSPKAAYRLEFTRKTNGKEKIPREIPGMGSVKNLILIPMVYDRTLMRDHLSWDVYAASLSEGEAFGAPAMQYVELFVNAEYRGVYLLLEPFDMRETLAKEGLRHLETDYVYRVGTQKSKPWAAGAYAPDRGFELRYAPARAADPFAGLAEYLDLIGEEEDGAFCKKALDLLDLPSMIRQLLLVEGGGMTDNILNNLFIWADRADGKTTYRFFPWDMDATWGDRENRIGPDFDYWIYFPTLDRLIDLNPDGAVRPLVVQQWRALRENAFSEAFIGERLALYTHELNDSGAAQRNGECWDLGTYLADPEPFLTFISVRLRLMDDFIDYLEAAPGRIEWLQYTDYENKSRQMNRDWFTLPGGEAVEETP